jgi:hypothetical protein
MRKNKKFVACWRTQGEFSRLKWLSSVDMPEAGCIRFLGPQIFSIWICEYLYALPLEFSKCDLNTVIAPCGGRRQLIW